MIRWTDTFWDGDWLLFMSDMVLGGKATPERFTIHDGEVRTEMGEVARINSTTDRTTFTLQDGRTVSIKLPGLSGDVYSATVKARSAENEWDEPTSWQRV